MSTLADRTIEALRANRDDLADQVLQFSAADLDRTSGSSQWDVAQVLSHLGSGAEIGLEGLRRALTGQVSPPQDFNQIVWDRWNAMSQQEKSDGFLESTELLLSTYEAIDAQTRIDLRFNLGFLPAPVDLAVVTGMRLNEALLHAWDVRVAFDPQASIPGALAAVLLEQFSGPVSFFMGFLGRTAGLHGERFTLQVNTTDPSGSLGLSFAESVSITEAPAFPDAVLSIPTEALMRLWSGRLSAAHTPEGVELIGTSLTLDDLRGVFPGL
ncbi:MAG: maleylpyruvate isomerase family mycothiol-dependent enzyme [Actinomycetota bacterium]|nr:maleylpyruvate isomerase family mycothiol-dependent enzyme [Actinomycetota bacterium]